jgi:DNA-binding NarL/FixJ family response regulator
MIRVLLIDEQTSFRQALAVVLQGEPDISVVAQAGSLAEAIGVWESVDVAVGDLCLPDAEGVDMVRGLRAANANGAVLILTASADRRQHALAMEAGAAGVLHKSVGIVEIITALRRLAAGELLVSPEDIDEMHRLARELDEHDRQAQLAFGRLTPREEEVLLRHYGSAHADERCSAGASRAANSASCVQSWSDVLVGNAET